MADDDATARRTTEATRGGPKKAAVRKVAAKAAPAPAKATVAKAPVARKAPAAAKAPVVKKPVGRKAVAGKAVAGKPVARKAVARKAVARKAVGLPGSPPAARTGGAMLAGRAKEPPTSQPAAERTFVDAEDDDPWEEPVPEPAPEDPAARVRSLLRAAALSLEARPEPARSAAAPPPPSPAPAPSPAPPPSPAPRPVPAPAPDQPVTRVLVSPRRDDPGLSVSESEVEGEWSHADVLDEPAAPPPPPPTPRPPTPRPPTPRPPPPPPTPPAPPATAAVEPQVVADPSPPPATQEPPKRPGAGLSIVAVVLALVVPLVGAIAGLVLSGRARRRGAALAGVARVVSVLALVGWLVVVGLVGFLALRDGGVDYSQLKVGDCFDSSQSNEVRGVKVKPCSKPHNSEIFFLVTHPAGPKEAYPGKDQLVQFAADACLGQPLTEYLGIPLQQSMLKDFEIVPQESAWKDGRRLLVCGIDTGGQGNITGSVMGTRR